MALLPPQEPYNGSSHADDAAGIIALFENEFGGHSPSSSDPSAGPSEPYLNTAMINEDITDLSIDPPAAVPPSQPNVRPFVPLSQSHAPMILCLHLESESLL